MKPCLPVFAAPSPCAVQACHGGSQVVPSQAGDVVHVKRVPQVAVIDDAFSVAGEVATWRRQQRGERWEERHRQDHGTATR